MYGSLKDVLKYYRLWQMVVAMLLDTATLLWYDPVFFGARGSKGSLLDQSLWLGLRLHKTSMWLYPVYLQKT